jgi:hypothetical protein
LLYLDFFSELNDLFFLNYKPEMARKLNFYLSLLVFSSIILAGCREKTQEKLNKAEFKDPPSSVKLHTWWHWMDGAVTKEGITKDLEAMKKQGIVQATMLNIGLFEGQDFGLEKKIFKSSEWLELFQWSLQEADRLGIKIGAHNCDGWSSSGGPWITPDLSMKQFVWTKTIISGDNNGTVMLSKPYANLDFYRDVAVVAFKTDSDLNSFHKANPTINIDGQERSEILTDGCPVSAIRISRDARFDIVFAESFSADKIVIHPRRSFMWGNMSDFSCGFTLFASDDGKNYKEIKEFQINGLNYSAEIEFPACQGKYYQLKVTEFSNVDAWIPFLIGELELLQKDESPLYNPDIPNLMVKIVSVKANQYEDINSCAEVNPDQKAISSWEVLNISDKMDENGALQWEIQEGNWTVIRFGYTPTGSRNAPATPEGRGLECNKMDTAALNVHFNNYPQVLIDKAGTYAGNTFKFFLIDSWECGYQNWTAIFPQEFNKRRGYDLHSWIPVLCGETIDNHEFSEGFLYDFRKTIAELIDKCYYQHFRDLCHKQGIEMHAEVIYGGTGYPPLDVLKGNSYADLHMHEFWAGYHPETSYPNYTPSERSEQVFPAQASVVYDLPVLGAEAYTAQAHYSESPWDLKRFGDRAYCTGVNQFILHSYVHQPDERIPGFTLGPFASHFNRHNLYWKHFSGWSDYHARIQYVLQKGNVKAHVLAYIGDQLPQDLGQDENYLLPEGYKTTFCNWDILANALKVKDGKIILSNGMSYDVLTIPDVERMELATLQTIANLVKDGAVLYGPKPLKVLSLTDMDSGSDVIQKLADELWGQSERDIRIDRPYGKGKIVWGKPLIEVLKDLKVNPSLETAESGTPEFLYIQKKLGNLDVFFVANQGDKNRNTELIFDAVGIPEIWDPERGEITCKAIYREEEGRTRVPMRFKPRQALFVIFREGKQSSFQEVQFEGKTVFPMSPATGSPTEIPNAFVEDGKIHVVSSKGGQYTLINNRDESVTIVLDPAELMQIEALDGEVTYEADYDIELGPTTPISFDSWTLSDNPDLKYLSGTATYSMKFVVNSDVINSGDSLLLSLGAIGTTAKVMLNGQMLGNVWQPDFRLPVNGIIKEENELIVEVKNLYRNRIIGDFIQYGELKNLWSTAPVGYYLDRDKSLIPSGLMGPAQLIRIPEYVVTK